MSSNNVAGINGWLLVYLILSIPLTLFHSAAFAGWVLAYPMWLYIPIVLILAVPLVLVLFKSPLAPKINVIALWVVAILMALRIITGVMTGISDRVIQYIIPLTSFALFPTVWAIIWTLYFKKSVRVKNTFKN